MSNFEDTLIGILRANAGIAALVDKRIYPMVVPQTSRFPAITYKVISESPVYTHDGDSGLSEVLIQFNCWADTFTGAQALYRAVKACLTGYANRSASNAIHSAFQTLKLDTYDSEVEKYGVILDYDITEMDT